MYVGNDYDQSEPGENEIYTLDFVRDMLAGETLSGATWTCVAVSGTDASASTRISGSATVSGTQTSQRCTGFLDGVKYRLEATVTTSLSNTKKLWSHVSVKAPG